MPIGLSAEEFCPGSIVYRPTGLCGQCQSACSDERQTCRSIHLTLNHLVDWSIKLGHSKIIIVNN